MRVLFIGDVVGKPGRLAVLDLIPELRKKRRIDAVVVNCENAAAGKGVTPELADEFLASGIDVLTTGNHVWQYKEINWYMESQSRLIRPANYPRGTPGHGSYKLSLPEGKSLGVIQVEGRVFMRPLESPFTAIAEELDRLGPTTATLVDLHCEATSEKQALAWHFAGKISAAVGTHTHVQTADERILPGGTAFLTDAGMTGPYDSVIGVRAELSIERFLTMRYTRHEVASENVWLCGALIDIDDRTGKATAIERVKEVWEGPGKSRMR